MAHYDDENNRWHDTGSMPAGQRLSNLEREMNRLKETLIEVRIEQKGLMTRLAIYTALGSFIAFGLVEMAVAIFGHK